LKGLPDDLNRRATAGLPTPVATLLTSLALALITAAVYWPVATCRFINLDDQVYVTENPHVRGGCSAANFIWAFTTSQASNWHPLTWLSHMLDSELFGPNAAGLTS
jgi:protein O-mannosyl-transferase